MKNILLIIFMLFINKSIAQNLHDNETQLSGIWMGEVEKHPIRLEIIQDKKNSTILIFTNFQNEKFSILKSDISANKKNEFVINIKNAKFSDPNYEKCVYNQGILTISDVTQTNMKLDLKSVGPNCFLSYDVIMNMPDINNLKLTKEK
ncbi:hypothetical protein [Chryseobacterium chendengshani]|uniref:hypothetical protein n=1 Tax=Chryseobacterium sp. LJ756 TaxID=2864113 RepID=UPI001C641846|nr:hypothetical protein [Chryseobacterium sp. LJ756]MBW7675160.1 hypothetical protein [Chryseobacterium sp. LJ756]